MFAKSLVAALAIVSVTAASVAPAFASDRGFEVKPVRSNKVNKSALAIGALVGLGGALLGAAAAHSQPRHADERYAPQRPVRFVDHDDQDDEECFEKPIKRFDRYSGEMIVIGHKTVCR
jgi:hypothetical protein